MHSAQREFHRPKTVRRFGRRRGRNHGRRAVSDVVATILLLALTVTLFASIFAWVTAFPPPPPQNNNQFQASLRYTGNLTYVNQLQILHLAGPSVGGSGLIYLTSSIQPTAPEFATPYTISSGLGGAGSWNLGQVWNLTFPLTEMPRAGGNITVYIVASSQLLFSVILPGTTLAPAPTVVSTWILPANPSKGQPFTVYASLAGNYGLNSVYVNLAAVPTLPATAQKMTQNSNGVWTYAVAAGGTTQNGTFYGFVNASNAGGQSATGIVTVTVSGFSFTQASITLSPTTLAHGTSQTVYINGTGFAATSLVSVILNGTVITPASCSPGTLSGSTITTSASGTFSCKYTMLKASGPAIYIFTANDYSSGQSATAYFSRT